MTELREDSPEPPASGDRTEAKDNPWLPPELHRPNADRQVEPPQSAVDEGFGAAPSSTQHSFGSARPLTQESFGAAPVPAPAEEAFSAPPPPPLGQSPVTDPASPLAAPVPVPAHRGLPWPRMRKPSSPSRSRTPGARSRGVAAAVVGVIIAGAVGYGIGAASKSDKSDSSPTAISRQLETAFASEGARFEVQPANDRGWAEKMRRTEGEQAGMRWIAVAVSMRNLGRARLRPRSLGYRIVLPSGFVIGPELAELDRSALEPGGLLGKGGRTSVHLGFRVPVDAHDVSLAFEAAGIRQPAVRVLLGAEG